MSDDKDKGATIIPFPQNRIVEKSTAGPQKDPKLMKKIQDDQTKEFVETSFLPTPERVLFGAPLRTDDYKLPCGSFICTPFEQVGVKPFISRHLAKCFF